MTLQFGIRSVKLTKKIILDVEERSLLPLLDLLVAGHTQVRVLSVSLISSYSVYIHVYHTCVSGVECITCHGISHNSLHVCYDKQIKKNMIESLHAGLSITQSLKLSSQWKGRRKTRR
jgi:ferredoxin